MTAPRLVLERICLEYSGQALFSDLSLTIPGGRTTCILGPSGCGKSTLLKLLAGAPRLEFRGAVRVEPAPTAPTVAWMSQNDLLLPWLSLLDNILLGARLRGELTLAHRNKALDLLAQAGLAEQAQTLPAALSGGMRQRGALLRTLMEGRPVILMDEPFSALDALNRLRLQNLAARLTSRATVVLVTHDPLEALRLGHHIVVLGDSPARVVRTLDLPGEPPREAADPALALRHAELLGLLLEDVA